MPVIHIYKYTYTLIQLVVSVFRAMSPFFVLNIFLFVLFFKKHGVPNIYVDVHIYICLYVPVNVNY